MDSIPVKRVALSQGIEALFREYKDDMLADARKSYLYAQNEWEVAQHEWSKLDATVKRTMERGRQEYEELYGQLCAFATKVIGQGKPDSLRLFEERHSYYGSRKPEEVSVSPFQKMAIEMFTYELRVKGYDVQHRHAFHETDYDRDDGTHYGTHFYEIVLSP